MAKTLNPNPVTLPTTPHMSGYLPYDYDSMQSGLRAAFELCSFFFLLQFDSITS